MKKLVLLSLLSATLFSCSNEEKMNSLEQNQKVLANNGSCKFELPDSGVNGKAAVWNWAYYRWPNQSVIKVKFLGNDATNADLKFRIKRYARLWLRHVNVNFEFVPSSAPADIKIIVGNEGATGNWSYCGIQCKDVAQNTPTMSIGDLSWNGTETWLRSTVIHEFGHALGMIHEHKSPNCDKTNWNKEAIISRYINQQGWTRDYVIQQIFNNDDPYYLDLSPYDRNSVMHYSFSALEMGTPTEIYNTELSVTDKSYMSSRYPLGNTESIFRFLSNGIHYYNRNAFAFAEGNTEGVLGRISKTQIPGTFPLYKHQMPYGDNYFNFQNTVPGYPQYVNQGIIGYAFKTPNASYPELKPIYHYWGNNHHFYTANYAELGAGGSGYVTQPTMFYLFP